MSQCCVIAVLTCSTFHIDLKDLNPFGKTDENRVCVGGRIYQLFTDNVDEGIAAQHPAGGGCDRGVKADGQHAREEQRGATGSQGVVRGGCKPDSAAHGVEYKRIVYQT